MCCLVQKWLWPQLSRALPLPSLILNSVMLQPLALPVRVVWARKVQAMLATPIRRSRQALQPLPRHCHELPQLLLVLMGRCGSRTTHLTLFSTLGSPYVPA